MSIASEAANTLCALGVLAAGGAENADLHTASSAAVEANVLLASVGSSAAASSSWEQPNNGRMTCAPTALDGSGRQYYFAQPEPKRRRGDGPGKQGWTRQEDATILDTVREVGTKWSRIASQLPGRTDDAVRNRYIRLQVQSAPQSLMRRVAQRKPDSPP